jgi:ribonuclease-3
MLKIGYKFIDSSLLQEALTHPSFSKGNGKKNYERLEWLGDHAISLMIAEVLYDRFPAYEEGLLSQIKANMVRTKTLALIALKIGLDQEVIIDRGEENAGGRNNHNNLENCLEAVAGAIYKEAGLAAMKEHLLPLWDEFLSDDTYLLKRDPKSALQEWSQSHKLGLPKYTVLEVAGLDHDKVFTVELELPDHDKAIGQGTSIKKAENQAAQNFINSNNII